MSDELLSLFRTSGALLEGHFQLSSGLHSPRYLQCARVLMDPAVAGQLGHALAEALRAVLTELPHTIVGPALGGILVAHEVARAMGTRAVFSERVDGVMSLRRGFTVDPGERVVVVEDVVTTGGSTREVMELLSAAGARVVGVGSLVDRSGGTVDLGVPRASLLTLAVPTFPPDACPLCAGGTPAVKPGSRPRP